MVKNKVGGNKAKKFARKNVNQDNINKKIRFATNEDELYAIVTKMIGNGQVNVMCIDNKERLCFIRNKFSGRNKQSNLITVGSWIIIGKRSWETIHPDKLEKCDLLEIYNQNEKHQLLQQCKDNFSVLNKQENILLNIDDNDNSIFSFEDENNLIIEENETTNINNNSTVVNSIIDDDDDDDIDIDEI